MNGKFMIGLGVCVLTGAYSLLNWRSLKDLDTELTEVRSLLVETAPADGVLLAPQKLAKVVTQARHRPFLFASQFADQQDAARTALSASPRRVAAWVRAHREIAWRSLAPGGKVRSPLSEEYLNRTQSAVVESGRIGLEAQSRIAEAAVVAEMRPEELTTLRELADEVQRSGDLAKDIAAARRVVFPARTDARRQVQIALQQIETANGRVDELAPLSELRQVVTEWIGSVQTLLAARRGLSSARTGSNPRQSAIAAGLIAADKAAIEKMIQRFEPQVSRGTNVLAEAERQESTFGGALVRDLQRFSRDTSEAFASSRIGKELAVSFKTLILGTKAFYDLMELQPGQDVLEWARRYERDFDTLNSATEDMLATDGWSLTGKNTFVEDFVNRAYEQSFGHPPASKRPTRAAGRAAARVETEPESRPSAGAPALEALSPDGNAPVSVVEERARPADTGPSLTRRTGADRSPPASAATSADRSTATSPEPGESPVNSSEARVNVGNGEYEIGNGVTAPRVVQEAKPSYTAQAMRAKIKGAVVVRCVVMPDGSVGRVEIVKSLDPELGLDEEAVKAVRQWRFLPGRRFDVPVPVRVLIELTFTLR